MTLTLTIPGLGYHGLSTKDAIISILANQWPLTIMKIYLITKREYGISPTYQAVHKMLHEMLIENLLLKDGNGYSLNPEWIKKVKTFSEKLEKSYSREQLPDDFYSKDVINLSFDNFIDALRFIVHTFHGEFPNPERKPRVAMIEHAWMPIGADAKDFLQIKRIFEIPYYGLYHGNTFLDHYANKFVVDLGKNSIYGVSYPAEGDIVVEGDYVAQIFYPPEFRKKRAELFSNVKAVTEFDLVKAFELYSGQFTIKIVITRNPGLAKSLREEGIKLFMRYQESHGLKSAEE